MHSVQIQNATIVEALQAVRVFSFLLCSIAESISSFELGGEKKTKGAALTFVCHLSHVVSLGITNGPTSSEHILRCFVVTFFSHHHATNMICVYVPWYHG